jgi:hypothetical protein
MQVNSLPRPVMPGYGCGEHRFDDEQPKLENGKNWEWEPKVAANS